MQSYLDKLIDWKEFEQFVTQLYKDSEEVIVEHNVILTGKSGVPRQIDVKVTHKSSFHTYLTLIECKSWKHRVDRIKIDAFASTIEDLGASKGVFFTTKGYQEGAIEYAKYKNIDIYVIRDLADDEWGPLGRHVQLYLQMINGVLQDFKINTSYLPFIKGMTPPPNFKLEIVFKKDYVDPNLLLYSTNTEAGGSNLTNILIDIRIKLIQTIGQQLSILSMPEGNDRAKAFFKTHIKLDFSDAEFRNLKFVFGIIAFNELEFDVLTSIDQSIFKADRGENLDFALVVENYITKQRNLVSKPKTFSKFNISDELKQISEDEKKDALQNNSVIKIYLEPYVSFEIDPDATIIDTEDMVLKMK